MSIVLSLLIAVHVLVCVFMILVVLMQRPRSEGLGSAFGGGITDNVFGSQTTNVLARFTTWMGIAFFAITLLLSILTAKANSGKSAIQKKLLSEPVPAAVSTPAPVSTPEATPAAEATPAVEATPVLEATPAATAVEATPQSTPEAESAVLEPAPEA
ncbi:MAG: preprotein translocase subunit SecG, partial [Spartobacteria bacterium]